MDNPKGRRILLFGDKTFDAADVIISHYRVYRAGGEVATLRSIAELFLAQCASMLLEEREGLRLLEQLESPSG